jgi:carbamoyl-phosphate synthase small subunit
MKAILALEDGTWFEGRSFTGEGESSGEVIFNTGMCGYQEILTDPSYAGQMVCMTYPHIGNYGVNIKDVESSRVWVEAFIVKEICMEPSNFRATMSLPEYLMENGVMGIEGIDTRALTRHLRVHGAMRGVMSSKEENPEVLVRKAQGIPSMEGLGLVDKVTVDRPYIWTDKGPEFVDLGQGPAWSGEGPRLLVYDFGIKWSILRLLIEEGFNVLVVPADFSAEEARALNPDGIFLSNGPGDPAALKDIIREVQDLTETYPTAGICLGHQILGHALGGKTFKLKFGHHGVNHPVKDLRSGKIEISSQNHGFCVDLKGLADIEETHVNLNDMTLSGFAHKTKPIIAVQYHPEAGPGPHDSRTFFKRFREMVAK